MKSDTPRLLFPARADFRAWLSLNAETSGGVWLIFGKNKTVPTLTANEALEEALCFGWIDGQMQSIDSASYIKYFARRRPKSPWSAKNKKTAEALLAQNRMTPLGIQSVEAARRDGTWDAPAQAPVTQEQAAAFAEKLRGRSPAHENFLNMPPSVRATYTRRYLSFKSEESRLRDFEKIVDRLNQNLKPM